MVTVGGEISGYCAIGSTLAAIKPASTNRIEMTAAKIGRSMKNFDIGEPYFDETVGFAPSELTAGVDFPSAPAAAGAAVTAVGVTVAPGRTLSRLSTITRSPAFNPDITVQF